MPTKITNAIMAGKKLLSLQITLLFQFSFQILTNCHKIAARCFSDSSCIGINRIRLAAKKCPYFLKGLLRLHEGKGFVSYIGRAFLRHLNHSTELFFIINKVITQVFWKIKKNMQFIPSCPQLYYAKGLICLSK